MWWTFCSLKWEQVDHLMGSKGWWSKEDLLPKTSKQSWGDTLVSYQFDSVDMCSMVFSEDDFAFLL